MVKLNDQENIGGFDNENNDPEAGEKFKNKISGNLCTCLSNLSYEWMVKIRGHLHRQTSAPGLL